MSIVESGVTSSHLGGYYNKELQTGGLIHSRNVHLTVLRAEKSKIKVLPELSPDPCPVSQTTMDLLCLLRSRKRTRELFKVPSISANPIHEGSPLTASPLPGCFPTPGKTTLSRTTPGSSFFYHHHSVRYTLSIYEFREKHSVHKSMRKWDNDG